MKRITVALARTDLLSQTALLYNNRQSSPFHVFHWWRAYHMRLCPSHQRARETMHYSPVNNKKYQVRHHVNTLAVFFRFL